MSGLGEEGLHCTTPPATFFSKQSRETNCELTLAVNSIERDGLRGPNGTRVNFQWRQCLSVQEVPNLYILRERFPKHPALAGLSV